MTGREIIKAPQYIAKYKPKMLTTRHDYLLWLKCVFCFFTLLNHLLVWSKMLSRVVPFIFLAFAGFVSFPIFCIISMNVYICVSGECVRAWNIDALSLFTAWIYIHNAKLKALNVGEKTEGWKLEMRHWCKRYRNIRFDAHQKIRQHIASTKKKV